MADYPHRELGPLNDALNRGPNDTKQARELFRNCLLASAYYAHGSEKEKCKELTDIASFWLVAYAMDDFANTSDRNARSAILAAWVAGIAVVAQVGIMMWPK